MQHDRGSTTSGQGFSCYGQLTGDENASSDLGNPPVPFLARDDPEPVMLQFMQPAVAGRDAIGKVRYLAENLAYERR